MTTPEKTNLQEKGFGSYLPIVIACSLFCGIPCAMCISCASIFYPVVAASLAVPVSEISLYSSMTFISSFLVSSLMGRWMERFDARIVLTDSLVLLCLCLAGMSVSTASWMFWIAGFFTGIATTGLLGMATPVLINRWFKRHVGLLSGICFAFTGIGGVIFLPIGQALIESYGWQTAYLAFAIISLVTCLPLTLFAIRSFPAERGLLPYGTACVTKHPEKAAKETSVPVAAAMRSPVFWGLGLFCLFCNFNVKIAFFFPTYVNTLESAGVAVLITGAMLSTLAMAGQAIGKICLGFTIDFSVKKATILSCVIGIVGILFCWIGASSIVMPIGGFIFGFFYASCMVLCPLVIREVLGAGKNYPVFWARLNAIATLGSATGTFLWPYISEQTGSFDAVFMIGVVMLAMIALIGAWCLKQKDRLPREE